MSAAEPSKIRCRWHWRLAPELAMLAIGRFDDTVNLGHTAADWLTKQVDQDHPDALSIVGMLHLRTAIAAAHRQDRTTTTTLLTSADRAASQLDRDADYWQTSFRPNQRQAAPCGGQPRSW